MPKISIIIPVFNVESYLEETVKSVLNQTFKNFELILVDDGSTDSSGKICDEYAEKDNRIVVIHKENGGVSSARNVALDTAKGDYIGFVDSDDLIDNNMYELLINTAIRENADIVQCEHNRDYPKEKPENIVCNEIKPKEFINLQYTLQGGRCTNILALWSKIYKKELFEDVRFPEGRVYEDHALMCKIVSKADKILISDAPLYHYIKRENSIITGFSPKKCQDKILALLDNCLFLKKYDNKLYLKSVLSLRNCVYSFCFSANKENRKFYFDFIKEHNKILSLNSSVYDKIYLKSITLGILKNYIADKEFEPIQKLLLKIRK